MSAIPGDSAPPSRSVGEIMPAMNPEELATLRARLLVAAYSMALDRVAYSYTQLQASSPPHLQRFFQERDAQWLAGFQAELATLVDPRLSAVESDMQQAEFADAFAVVEAHLRRSIPTRL